MKYSSHPIIILVLTIILNAPGSYAQSSDFAIKGTTELGGSISFQSFTPVSAGKAGNSYKIFSLAPYVGYFVTDGFEIGLNPFGITSVSGAGSSSTQIMILAAPSYNFKTEGFAYPFAEALLGFTSQSGSLSKPGFSWGGRFGVKLAITGNGLLNLGMQYLQIDMRPSGATERYGSNQLTVSAGFTIWY